MEAIMYDTPEGIVKGKNSECLQSYPIIVMEMLSGGHLLEKVKNNIEKQIIPSESYLAGLFRNVAQSLESIHIRNYIHRDLKLENLIVVSPGENSEIKIIDFGSMLQIPPSKSKVVGGSDLVGTNGYLAPETISNREYSYMTDVWQIGCILFT